MRGKRLASLIVPLALLSTAPAFTFNAIAEEEKVGERPYEMVWANRNEEVRTPLCDFENCDGWDVVTTNSIATFTASREQQMYGKYVGKLTYRVADGNETPVVELRLKEPVPVPDKDFDTISCWIYGNNWAWQTDSSTPRVTIYAIFKNDAGGEATANLTYINWKEWFLEYERVSSEARKTLGDTPSFVGFRVVGGVNKEDRVLYFDSFCAFKEELKPLDIKLRAKPGIDLFEGQDLGINSGEGRLPFPTTPDTILPVSATETYKPASHFYGDSCDFVYEADNALLTYTYKPSAGDWSDITARWNGSQPFQPCANGGVKTLVAEDGTQEPVEKALFVKLEQTEYGARSFWKLSSKNASADVEYRFRVNGKSLIVDTIALGGKVAYVSAGELHEIESPRVVTIPYYLYDYGKRPGVAIFKPTGSDETLFASAHIDWYRSSASYLLGQNGVDTTEKQVLVGELGHKHTETVVERFARVNGGAEYRAKTDGKYNDVYERFIFTISGKFEETLPSIPNPKSPYRAVAGKGVWRAHGATTRDADKKLWRDVWRRGMRHIIVTDHEVCWRDGGESFTFRTKPAPGKGGDAGWIDYSRFMQDTLGFVYGPYNNFTDFSPVNEYWSPDMVGRQQNGSLQHAWARCYAPKPTRAVDFCERLTPINQEKFQFSCAYCDVHSSVPAWTRTDYDARVPGAGTFMSVFYPYGEIFLLQKKNWKGPTYSEGPHHCFYAGLTDGNYAQDQPYNMFKNQWLVDFDLLKIHEQEVDFGMGDTSMFAPGYHPATPEESVDFMDRFLAATCAFGHSGFLPLGYGDAVARAYFMIQQIAAYYTQSSVESIRYIDADGNQLTTSEALVQDVVSRSQLFVRYKDGTVVVSNGSNKETLKTEVDGKQIVLPPNGYTAWTADGKVVVESYLSESGNRYDYCASPEYIFLDGRGSAVRREFACGEGQGVCRILEDGKFEFLLTNNAEIGFKIAADDEELTGVALDYDGNEIGDVEIKRSRGYAYVVPKEGAFSYVVSKTGKKAQTAAWSCGRLNVAAGETVEVVSGDKKCGVEIPADAQLGKLWVELEDGSAFDFFVVKPFKSNFSYDPQTNVLKASFVPNVPNLKFAYQLKVGGNSFNGNVSASSDAAANLDLAFTLAPPTEEGEENGVFEYETTFANGKTVKEQVALQWNAANEFIKYENFDFSGADLSADGAVKKTPYVQLRGKAATTNFDGTNATKYWDDERSGGVGKQAWFLHPPYSGGVGRTFIRNDFTVPTGSASFRMSIGRRDGSDAGDGILFKIAVAEFDENGALIPESEKVLAEKNLTEFKWDEMEADLSPYLGKKISLLVISDCGEHDDTSGDWAAVADLRLETADVKLVRTLKSVQ